jgi:hypothetical protein
MALAQRGVDPLPGALIAPLGNVVEHRGPGRILVRHRAPLAASAQEVKHGLHNAAQPEELGVAGLLAWCDERSENGPFLVAQVGRVRVRVHPNQMATAS